MKTLQLIPVGVVKMGMSQKIIKHKVWRLFPTCTHKTGSVVADGA